MAKFFSKNAWILAKNIIVAFNVFASPEPTSIAHLCLGKSNKKHFDFDRKSANIYDQNIYLQDNLSSSRLAFSWSHVPEEWRGYYCQKMSVVISDPGGPNTGTSLNDISDLIVHQNLQVFLIRVYPVTCGTNVKLLTSPFVIKGKVTLFVTESWWLQLWSCTMMEIVCYTWATFLSITHWKLVFSVDATSHFNLFTFHKKAT